MTALNNPLHGNEQVVALLDEAGTMVLRLAHVVKALSLAFSILPTSGTNTDDPVFENLAPGVAEQAQVDAAKHYFKERYGLTNRELEVLPLIARGMTDRQVAAALSFSERHVASHWLNIHEKLGGRTTAELIALAVKHGLIQVYDEES